MKNIAKIYAPPAPHMVGDGFRVHNFIPTFPALSMQRMDPFIMLDYGSKFVFPPAPTKQVLKQAYYGNLSLLLL